MGGVHWNIGANCVVKMWVEFTWMGFVLLALTSALSFCLTILLLFLGIVFGIELLLFSNFYSLKFSL